MIRSVIIDDERLARDLVRKLLESHDDIEIVAECGSGAAGVKSIREFGPDLVFLDVQMPGLDGFDMLRQLGGESLPYVIFVTAYDQYALQAFEVHALDYLMKPIDKQRFRETLDRARTTLKQRAMAGITEKITDLLQADHKSAARSKGPGDFLVLQQGNEVKKIPLAEIVWIEAANQYVQIHTEYGKHLMTESLSSLEKTLDPERFFRIHRSAIVQASHVEGIRRLGGGRFEVRMRSGEKLALSRRRKQLLEDLLAGMD